MAVRWTGDYATSTLVFRAEKKNALYLRVNVFSAKVLIGDTIFYVSNWRRDRHFTWSSEPREGLACCSAKGVLSSLSYFKTLSVGPAPGIEPATSRSTVNTLYRKGSHSSKSISEFVFNRARSTLYRARWLKL